METNPPTMTAADLYANLYRLEYADALRVAANAGMAVFFRTRADATYTEAQGLFARATAEESAAYRAASVATPDAHAKSEIYRLAPTATGARAFFLGLAVKDAAPAPETAAPDEGERL